MLMLTVAFHGFILHWKTALRWENGESVQKVPLPAYAHSGHAVIMKANASPS